MQHFRHWPPILYHGIAVPRSSVDRAKKCRTAASDELDEEWIGYAAVDMLETLEHIFHPVTKDLRDKMAGKCNNFSDCIAFLPSFRKAINRKIADIEHLVNATKTVNDTSALDQMLDETSYPYEWGS